MPVTGSYVRVLMLAIGAFGAAAAVADESSPWLAGMQLGSARGSAGGAADPGGDLSTMNLDVTTTVGSKNRLGWRVFTGYRFTNYLALQIGYTDLGKVDSGFSDPQPLRMLGDIRRPGPQSARGVDLGLQLKAFVTDRLALSARGGIYRWKLQQPAATSFGASDRSDQRDSDAFFGAGAEVSLVPNLSGTVEWVRYEVARGLPPPEWDNVIIATGPLTSPALSGAIQKLTGETELAFFDAIAPIVHLESIDETITWRQSRYDKAGPGGTGADYINCPMSRAEYEAFLDALLAAEKTSFKEWEASTPYFDGCLPIEVMAERGRETLRFGPMKPVGLTNPHPGTERPYAVVQLRQDNALGTLWNMVGFQTKLKHGEQARVFRLIPGLANAEFARLGGLHRNTFLNSPKLLDGELRLRAEPRLRFAGQITGCEGYVESAAIGLLAGRAAAAGRLGQGWTAPPPTTAFGALLGHITGGHLVAEEEGERGGSRSFQPMNVNFGLFPPLDAPSHDAAGNKIKGKDRGVARKRALSARALADLDAWLASPARAAAE